MLHPTEYELLFRPGDHLLVKSADRSTYVTNVHVVSVNHEQMVVEHRFVGRLARWIRSARYGKRPSFTLTPTADHRIWEYEGVSNHYGHLLKPTEGVILELVPPSRSAPSVETQSSVEAL